MPSSLSTYFATAKVQVFALLLIMCGGVFSCGPGTFGTRRRITRKLTPLILREHYPNSPENTLSASGPATGAINNENHPKFKELVPNYNPDIAFEDREGNGEDRLMTTRCKEKLNTLAISTMNMYPGVRLRVVEAYDLEGLHAPGSLHYEGRAVDLTTSDRDRSKLGMLARLAIEAGFDFVYFKSRYHIHASVKSESADATRLGGCFSGNAVVETRSGIKRMEELQVGDQILVTRSDGVVDFSEVLLFLHVDPNRNRTHVVLVTETGKRLTMTPSHVIFVQTDGDATELEKGYSIFARDVAVGHFVYVRTSTGKGTTSPGVIALERVTDVSISVETGVYAPLTAEGNLIVNEIVVSCYALIQNHYIANAAFLPVRLWMNAKNSVFHLFKKIHFIRFEQNPRRDRAKLKGEGIHWYAATLYKLGYYLFPETYLYQ